MSIVIDLCFFIMWFGAWSSCHGWGAVGMAVLWALVMAFCGFCQVAGCREGAWTNLFNRSSYAAVLLWLAVWSLYFVGLGDWVRLLLPKSFPEGGVVFFWSQCGFVQVAVLIVWCVLKVRNVLCMIERRREVEAASKAAEDFETNWRIADIVLRVVRNLVEIF